MITKIESIMCVVDQHLKRDIHENKYLNYKNTQNQLFLYKCKKNTR